MAFGWSPVGLNFDTRRNFIYYESMISHIRGKVLCKGSEYIILETNGVGYKVFLPEALRAQFTEGQEQAEIFCALQVRKDETLELYGLPSFEALKLFEVFRDVSGIGPKAAMVLASLGKPEDIRKAIASRNTGFFRGIKGIGEKKIQKVIVELTGKLGVFEEPRSSGDEAVDSLVSLGFSRAEARNALSRVAPEITDLQAKIKEALKFLGRR